MQQFTRSLTREIEVGGERLAVTLSKEGLSVRPVGGRRPPHEMTWEAWLCACVSGAAEHPPTVEQIQEALKSVRAGATKKEKAESAGDSAPAASSPPAAAAAHPVAPTATSGHGLHELLGRLDHWLSAHRSRFHHALKPGASGADCDTLSAALGKPLPEELRTWLSWHNGQNADVPGAFEQSFNLMSAQEMAEAKKEIESQPHEGWQTSWVPFLEDDNGNYLCLDLGSPGCPVLECWRGRTDHPVAAPSLLAWVTNFVHAMERGEYREDSERGTFNKS